MRLMTVTTLAAMFAVAPAFPRAQDAAPPQQTGPDNTDVNKRDRNKSEHTADQQNENKEDRELARRIRRAIVADKSLSTYAHNIKVIAENGTVTLKGPVHTEDEKKAVEAKAAEVAGNDKVRSELSVTGEK